MCRMQVSRCRMLNIPQYDQDVHSLKVFMSRLHRKIRFFTSKINLVEIFASVKENLNLWIHFSFSFNNKVRL